MHEDDLGFESEEDEEEESNLEDEKVSLIDSTETVVKSLQD